MSGSACRPVELVGTIKTLGFLSSSPAVGSYFRFMLLDSGGRLFPLQYSAKNHELAREMHSSLISDTQVRVLIEGPVQDNRNCYDVIEIVHAPGEERTD